VACGYEMAYEDIACTIISPDQMKITYTCKTHPSPSTIVKNVGNMMELGHKNKFAFKINPGGQEHVTAPTR
jgi:hypothetical protein